MPKIYMLNAKLKIFVLIFACQLLFVTQALSNEIRIAVASNFYSTMQEIIVQFESENIDTSQSVRKINTLSRQIELNGRHIHQPI